MPNYAATITSLIAGDFRQIPFTIPNVPTGGSLTKAWLTVKVNDTDLDAAAKFQKIITSSLSVGQGHITSTGSGTGVATGFFNLLESETILLTPLEQYFFDIQLQFTMSDASTRLETPEKGIIDVLQGITDAII